LAKHRVHTTWAPTTTKKLDTKDKIVLRQTNLKLKINKIKI